MKETEYQAAFAPHFSVILPIGDEDEGLGTDEVGYQINLPLSKKVGQWAFHANAGLTAIPDVKAGVDPALSFSGRTPERLQPWRQRRLADPAERELQVRGACPLG